ncbi:MAG: Mur ligase family protein, partial [Cyanobacteria bacterium P01_D01_bin.2]
MESAKLAQPDESCPIAYVIGLGLSGVAAARLLKRQGWQVVVSDRNDGDRQIAQQQALTAEGIDVKLGHSFSADDPMTLVVVSPGVPWDLPGLVEAREKGISTIGEMELAWRALSHLPWVGVTGTNGKTTTTELIAAIFKTADLNAPACGNIGYAA